MAEIPLRSRKYPGHVALLDDADLDLITPYTWCLLRQDDGRRLYAVAARKDGTGRQWRMHVLIMGRRGIDHANGNGLDNRRINLRAATQSQNGANGPPKGGTSRFKGPVLYPSGWTAYIHVNRRTRYLGRFATEEAAARAYDAAAREAWGEFARVNFP